MARCTRVYTAVMVGWLLGMPGSAEQWHSPVIDWLTPHNPAAVPSDADAWQVPAVTSAELTSSAPNWSWDTCPNDGAWQEQGDMAGHSVPNGAHGQRANDCTPKQLKRNLRKKLPHGGSGTMAEPVAPTKRKIELQYASQRIQAAIDAYLETLDPADRPARFSNVKSYMAGGNVVLQELPQAFRDSENNVVREQLPIELAVRVMNRSIFNLGNRYRCDIAAYLDSVYQLNKGSSASVFNQQAPKFSSNWTKIHMANDIAKHRFAYVLYWDSNERKFRSMSFGANSPPQDSDYAMIESMTNNPYFFMRYGALKFTKYHESAKVLVDHHVKYLNTFFRDEMLQRLG